MEDGKTILYEVFKNGIKNGEFKVLSLGIEQIRRTCNQWNFRIGDYEIRRIADGEIVWRGSVNTSSDEVSINR
jgi:hypothetical protein